MRFAFLAAALICGMTTVSAQNQKPAPKHKQQQLIPSSNLGQRNTGSPNQNVVIGGSDDCNTPDAINGIGTFAFDQTAATTGTEGQTEYSCYKFGSSAVDNDVWFLWTAPTTDTFQFETCNLSTTDTKIAVYPGSTCPAAGTVIACNDDTCGLQSQVTFSGTAGSAYMLQVGTFPGAAGGTGSFDMSVFQPEQRRLLQPHRDQRRGELPLQPEHGDDGHRRPVRAHLHLQRRHSHRLRRVVRMDLRLHGRGEALDLHRQRDRLQGRRLPRQLLPDVRHEPRMQR